MSRFAPYPRRAYRDLFRAWSRSNKKVLSVLFIGHVALLAFATTLMLILIPESRFRWWFLGALQAAVVAIALHLVNAAFASTSRPVTSIIWS